MQVCHPNVLLVNVFTLVVYLTTLSSNIFNRASYLIKFLVYDVGI